MASTRRPSTSPRTFSARCSTNPTSNVACAPIARSSASRRILHAQREATKLAAERAGIEKVRLLEEPVAAALAYGVGQGDDDELVLVFDLGGGTLDVSVLRVGGGTAEVLSAAGEPWLGGDDFDVAIAAFLASRRSSITHGRLRFLTPRGRSRSV